MTDTNKPLDELRREIDEIDTAMHDLIMRRTQVVAKVMEAKGKTATAGFVPGREAAVLRRLLARHDGAFPRQALARIWRELISVFAAMQGPYAVVAYADGADQTCWDLARDHFGSHDAMSPLVAARDVVARVHAGEAAIGVAPIPADADDAPWWQLLCGVDAPRIVARLPFVGGGNARDGKAGAYAIARVSPDSTGDDHALLVIETNAEVSRAGLRALVSKAGLEACSVVSREGDVTAHLVEVETFVAPDDDAVRRIEQTPGVSAVFVIGAFAVPLPAGGAAS